MINYLKVNYDAFTYVTSEADPDDKWSRDSTSSNYTYNHLELVDGKKGYRDVSVPFDVKKGDELYCVIAEYDTGDSFGSDTAAPEFIAVFKTEEEARDLITQIRSKEDSKTGEYPSQIKLNLHGKEFLFQVPWYGYFEHLNDLFISKLEVK